MSIERICDQCGSRPAEQYSIWNGKWQTCPAGGASEMKMNTVDLCNECAASKLKLILATHNKKYDGQFVERFVEIMKPKKKG